MVIMIPQDEFLQEDMEMCVSKQKKDTISVL